MIVENIVFFILLFVFNMVFVIKRVPLIGMPFGIITFFIGATYYLPLGEYDVIFCILLMFVGVCDTVINAMYYRKN
jgi:hypothetical protein